jgi:predicted RNA polymerase sigma factor
MKPMFGPLLFLGLMIFPGPALAQDEATIKGAFIMCGTQHVLIACDDLVQMPDLNNVVRSNAYGVRAATLLRLGRVEDAKRDLDEALRLNPDNQTVIDFKALLLEKGL